MEKIIWPGSTQLAPVPAVLVGCGNDRNLPFNVLTIAWTGIVCSEPPLVAVSIRPERYSFDLVSATNEFTVNVPSDDMAEKVDFCGVKSGREIDKIAACGFTAVSGSRVAAPVIAECPISLECRVVKRLALGSHELFIGEIVAVQVERELVNADGRFDIDRAKVLGYAHGHYYRLGECIGHFGFSVRKKAGSPIRR